MESSEEIGEVMLEVVRAFADGDPAAWRNLWSSRPEIISLGTDPRELWEGYETVVSLQSKQFAERGPLVFDPARVHAFQEGSVGWAVYATTGVWAGNTLPSRFTGIFHLEGGQWKLVHLHKSLGFRNEEVGVRLTTSLEEIAETVERERPDLAAVTAPNGNVAILFTDIQGSARLMEQVGDTEWMNLLRVHNALVRKEAAAHSGYEVKSLGDGFMLAFASASEALRCAIGIQRAIGREGSDRNALPVRIGLHTGEAIREADDFYGKAVVLAARIAAEARGSEILVSAAVRQLTESSGEFTFEGTTEAELRGLSGHHRLSAVRWE
jgi:class 3 adenylate cyclase